MKQPHSYIRALFGFSSHHSLFNLISLNRVLIGLHKGSGSSVERGRRVMGREEEGRGDQEEKASERIMKGVF